MTTPGLYRELAEEIARRMIELEAREPVVTTPRNQQGAEDELLAEWEARLRSAFPSVFSLLGELATIRGALEELDRCCRVITWRNDDATHTYSGPYRSDRPPWSRVKAALAPGSGRLAGEVIRAAGKVRDWLRDADRDPLFGPLADLVNAVDALIADRPELGREVEGG